MRLARVEPALDSAAARRLIASVDGRIRPRQAGRLFLDDLVQMFVA